MSLKYPSSLQKAEQEEIACVPKAWVIKVRLKKNFFFFFGHLSCSNKSTYIILHLAVFESRSFQSEMVLTWSKEETRHGWDDLLKYLKFVQMCHLVLSVGSILQKLKFQSHGAAQTTRIPWGSPWELRALPPCPKVYSLCRDQEWRSLHGRENRQVCKPQFPWESQVNPPSKACCHHHNLCSAVWRRFMVALPRAVKFMSAH